MWYNNLHKYQFWLFNCCHCAFHRTLNIVIFIKCFIYRIDIDYTCLLFRLTEKFHKPESAHLALVTWLEPFPRIRATKICHSVELTKKQLTLAVILDSHCVQFAPAISSSWVNISENIITFFFLCVCFLFITSNPLFLCCILSHPVSC